MAIQDMLIQGVLIFAVFYFVLYAPQRKKQKELKAIYFCLLSNKNNLNN